MRRSFLVRGLAWPVCDGLSIMKVGPSRPTVSRARAAHLRSACRGRNGPTGAGEHANIRSSALVLQQMTGTTGATTSSLGFHAAVAAWFERRFPDGPTEAQARGWRLIAQARDTLI